MNFSLTSICPAVALLTARVFYSCRNRGSRSMQVAQSCWISAVCADVWRSVNFAMLYFSQARSNGTSSLEKETGQWVNPSQMKLLGWLPFLYTFQDQPFKLVRKLHEKYLTEPIGREQGQNIILQFRLTYFKIVDSEKGTSGKRFCHCLLPTGKISHSLVALFRDWCFHLETHRTSWPCVDVRNICCVQPNMVMINKWEFLKIWYSLLRNKRVCFCT